VFIYIHGFNSNGESSLNNLRKCLNDVIGLKWNCADTFENNLNKLSNDLEKLHLDDDTVLIGTSMGGFWSAILAKKFGLKSVLFNPVIDPKVTLMKFKGYNKNFSTLEEYILTEEVIKSYVFEDPRISMPKTVILGKNDDIIDYHESEEYWKNYSNVIITDEEHRINDYSKYVNEINEIKNSCVFF